MRRSRICWTKPLEDEVGWNETNFFSGAAIIAATWALGATRAVAQGGVQLFGRTATLAPRVFQGLRTYEFGSSAWAVGEGSWNIATHHGGGFGDWLSVLLGGLHLGTASGFGGAARSAASEAEVLGQAGKSATRFSGFTLPEGLTTRKPTIADASEEEIARLHDLIASVLGHPRYIKRALRIGFTPDEYLRFLTEVADRAEKGHINPTAELNSWIDDQDVILSKASGIFSPSSRIRHEFGHLLDMVRNPDLMEKASDFKNFTWQEIYKTELVAFRMQFGRYGDISLLSRRLALATVIVNKSDRLRGALAVAAAVAPETTLASVPLSILLWRLASGRWPFENTEQ